MKPEPIQHTAALSILMLAAAAWLYSFAPPFSSEARPEADLIPIHTLLNALQADSYEPEFSSRADSVIIPMKRSGRLFLIEAMADGESGNLVFDTGANGLVLNSTYFRNHVKSVRAGSIGITGTTGTGMNW